MAQPVRAGLTTAEGRSFGLTVGGAFLALAIVAWHRGREATLLVTGTLGTLLVLAGLGAPRRLGPVKALWTAAAQTLSKVTTPVLMSVVYFLVFTPAGMLVRALGRRTIVRSRVGSSVWMSRAGRTRSDMRRQF